VSVRDAQARLAAVGFKPEPRHSVQTGDAPVSMYANTIQSVEPTRSRALTTR
jgi:hypothetical protein